MSVRSIKNLPTKRVRPPQRLVVLNPSKGLNNLVSPSLIDNREFSDMQNMEYDEGGVIRKRAGYVAFGSALTASKGLGMYATESTRYLVTADSGVLKYNIGSGWTASTGATFTLAKDMGFTQARLRLICWDGSLGGAYFDGSVVTRPGTMPRAKFSIYYQNKHIASGVDGQPSRIYVSSVSDATDFTVTTGGVQPQPDSTNDAENGQPNVPGATVFAGTPGLTEANLIDVRKNDGDKITGLGIFQDVVIIFKERSIYQLVFDTSGNPTVTPITYSTGCVSHKSIKAVENDLYFLSREGIRVLGNEAQYFDAIRSSVISVRIQPTMDTVSKTYYSRSNAVYFDNKYILALPIGGSSIAQTVTYDRRFKAHCSWVNFNAQDMVRFIDSTNSEDLYFLDDRGTQVYKRVPGTYTDAGVAIESYVTSKAQDIGNPDLTKFWIDIRLILRRLNGSIKITVYSDDNTTIGTATLSNTSLRGLGRVRFGKFKIGLDGKLTTTSTGSIIDTPQSIGLNLDSRTLKYKIYNNGINENFVLLGTVYAYYPKSHFVFDSSKKIYL